MREVVQPARTVHQLKLHSTRLNVQSGSNAFLESESPFAVPKARLWGL